MSLVYQKQLCLRNNKYAASACRGTTALFFSSNTQFSAPYQLEDFGVSIMKFCGQWSVIQTVQQNG